MDRFWFTYRQGAGGGYSVDLTNQLKALEGKPHDIVFVGKGDQVTATLDGKPISVNVSAPQKSGCLQIGGNGKWARILSIDIR